MTEYDYSPDAIERFQAKMAGVGKWATDQRYYAPKYANPFLPEDQASSSRSGARTPARQETYPQPAPKHHDPTSSPLPVPDPCGSRPHQAAPRASPGAYPGPPPPPGTRQVVMEYKYVPGQAIKLPPPRRGEQYIIVPPKGGRLEVVTPDSRKSSSHTRTMSHSHSSGSRSKGSSPTKVGGDPLFKRLITNLTPKIEWGDGRSGGRPVKRESSRRRSASR
ncbi:hypothetical protein C8T65DRAFT_700129 [Cerioporus squamosus]|nr:hypothetical protein C8T65DRAFT_700129 [Cerioporus squamosus]